MMLGGEWILCSLILKFMAQVGDTKCLQSISFIEHLASKIAKSSKRVKCLSNTVHLSTRLPIFARAEVLLTLGVLFDLQICWKHVYVRIESIVYSIDIKASGSYHLLDTHFFWSQSQHALSNVVRNSPCVQ